MTYWPFKTCDTAFITRSREVAITTHFAAALQSCGSPDNVLQRALTAAPQAQTWDIQIGISSV